MTTQSTDVSQTSKRIGDAERRHKQHVHKYLKITFDEYEEKLDELFNLDFDRLDEILSTDAIIDLYELVSSFVHFDKVTEQELIEGLLYTRGHTNSQKRKYARLYYKQNRSKILSKMKKLKKFKGAVRDKKKSIQKKKRKTPTGRDMRKYHTKSHLEEQLENKRDFFVFQNEHITRNDIFTINLQKKNLCTIVLKDGTILTERTNDNQSLFDINHFLKWYHKDEDEKEIVKKYFINEGIFYV